MSALFRTQNLHEAIFLNRETGRLSEQRELLGEPYSTPNHGKRTSSADSMASVFLRPRITKRAETYRACCNADCQKH